MNRYEIGLLKDSNIATAQEIERLCFGSKWTATNFASELKNEQCRYFCALVDQKLVGYIGYWKILEEAHITSVAVHPWQQKQHIAQALMCALLEDCLDSGIEWVTLEVKESNSQAQNLYQKFGFAVLGRRRNYYQSDRQDALIMWTENIAAVGYPQLIERLKADTPFSGAMSCQMTRYE